MHASFHQQNRSQLYALLPDGAVVVLYSGKAPRKTNDEDYPFFANRNFLYCTGVDQQESILLCNKRGGVVEETLFLLPRDLMFERWNGVRIAPEEASEQSGIQNVATVDQFQSTFDRLVLAGNVASLFLDFDKRTAEEPDSAAYKLAAYCQARYPFLSLQSVSAHLKTVRTIKKDCEIEAMRKAEIITAEGIMAMMKASKPGMYEYQYKAEFDYALAQHGVLTPGFPSIISAGKNNFCIHYYSYRGQAQDGDMILNDVGACFDNEINDVSRGWPCNGKFSEKQALLYQCAYNTSEHLFHTLKPGMPMASVDQTVRKYNFEQLKAAGVCDSYDKVGTYMWHGGAHHVGYDVHDVVDMSRPLTPGMVFCVDVGIYHEEWGIGFRLEDNCLITEDGCENLSNVAPRSIEDIEAFMGNR